MLSNRIPEFDQGQTCLLEKPLCEKQTNCKVHFTSCLIKAFYFFLSKVYRFVLRLVCVFIVLLLLVHLLQQEERVSCGDAWTPEDQHKSQKALSRRWTERELIFGVTLPSVQLESNVPYSQAELRTCLAWKLGKKTQSFRFCRWTGKSFD